MKRRADSGAFDSHLDELTFHSNHRRSKTQRLLSHRLMPFARRNRYLFRALDQPFRRFVTRTLGLGLYVIADT